MDVTSFATYLAAGRSVLEALVDVGEWSGPHGSVCGEDVLVHPAEEGPVDGEHEESVNVLAEFRWREMETWFGQGCSKCHVVRYLSI